MDEKNVQALVESGKIAFMNGDFLRAVQAFRQAAEWYTNHGLPLEAAEAKNNLSVALLKNGKADEALQAALGTDAVFAQASDLRRQGMALGNQAAALEALGRLDEAVERYERSAEVFADAGEGDLQSLMLKSIASIQLRRGKLEETGIGMLGSLEAVKKPTWIQRLLKFLLRILPF